jgi:hypothetical protein
MKRVAAREHTVLIPLVVRLAIVQVQLPIINIAPEIQRLRVAVHVANMQHTIYATTP